MVLECDCVFSEPHHQSQRYVEQLEADLSTANKHIRCLREELQQHQTSVFKLEAENVGQTVSYFFFVIVFILFFFLLFLFFFSSSYFSSSSFSFSSVVLFSVRFLHFFLHLLHLHHHHLLLLLLLLLLLFLHLHSKILHNVFCYLLSAYYSCWHVGQ